MNIMKVMKHFLGCRGTGKKLKVFLFFSVSKRRFYVHKSSCSSLISLCERFCGVFVHVVYTGYEHYVGL